LSARGDSPVQRAGALGVEPRVGTRRREALDVIRAAGSRGVTFDELCGTVGRDYSQVGPRVRELVADGWVVKAGRTRPGSHGAEQEVWVSAAFAEAQAP
jgi:predicted transcriptional regulator